MRVAKIESGNLEGLYPFLILLLIGLMRLLKAKKKKEETRVATKKAPTPAVAAPMGKKKSSLTPPPVAPEVEKTQAREYTSLEVKKDLHYARQKKKARIQKLVASSGSKRKMILLSEILKSRSF